MALKARFLTVPGRDRVPNDQNVGQGLVERGGRIAAARRLAADAERQETIIILLL